MMHRLLVILIGSALLVFVPVPTQAVRGGDIYEQGTYDDPYTFKDRECGFLFKVKGRARGHFINRNVPGSDGQAFLGSNRYRFHERLTNPANGKRMYIRGRGHLREVSAKHVKGDIWRFKSVETGIPFVMLNARRKAVVKDHGRVVRLTTFDTLGDSKPGGEVLKERILRTRGDFPSLEKDFDFCKVVKKLIG